MTTRTVWLVASLGLAGCGQTMGATAEAFETPDNPSRTVAKCDCSGCPCVDRAMIQAIFIDTLGGGSGKASQASAPADHTAKFSVENLLSPEPSFQIVYAADSAGDPLALDVSHDHLSAVELVPPFSTLEGSALQGVAIWVSDTHNELFELLVDKVSLQDLHFWEGAPQPVEAYELTYLRIDPPDPGGTATDVCSGQGTSSDPLWGGVPHAAILFADEYIDVDHAAIGQPRPGMFHIGCPGSTHARMHLSRHTRPSDHDGQFPTTLDQRLAMLKMFSADYCGTGQRFTTDNYPLRWLDNTGWTQPALDLDPKHGQITSIEAIWGPEGAVCLDTPRKVSRDQVPCALPTCQDVASWAAQGHVISANPVLP
jgi:ADYC domain-containing protein